MSSDRNSVAGCGLSRLGWNLARTLGETLFELVPMDESGSSSGLRGRDGGVGGDGLRGAIEPVTGAESFLLNV